MGILWFSYGFLSVSYGSSVAGLSCPARGSEKRICSCCVSVYVMCFCACVVVCVSLCVFMCSCVCMCEHVGWPAHGFCNFRLVIINAISPSSPSSYQGLVHHHSHFLIASSSWISLRPASPSSSSLSSSVARKGLRHHQN